MSKIFRYFIWFLASAGAAAIVLSVLLYFVVAFPRPEVAPAQEGPQTSRLPPPGPEMHAVPQIDFSAGPVDLIVTEDGKDWLVRDQALVRKAAETGVPDTSSDETKLLFTSILFLSPPGRSPPTANLTFLRDGKKLVSVGCMETFCGKLPELRSLFDPLIAAGKQIETRYESFTVYDDYLAAYARVEKSADRYGPIDPAVPEELRKLDQKLYITFPLLYRKTPPDGWLTPVGQAYDKAFRKEYADFAGQFDLKVSESLGEGMALLRCSDEHMVMSKDETQAIFPSDWKFAAITGTLSATDTMADQVATRTDWSFLPELDNDNDALTRDIRATVNQLGNQVDPDGCYYVHFAPGSDEVSVWRDYPYSYSIRWTQILPKGIP